MYIEQSPPWKEGSMKSTRVLILDDESTMRTALFRTLDRKGYSVVTSQSIEEAKSYCSADKFFDLASLM